MDRQTLHRQDDRAAFIRAQAGHRSSPRPRLQRKSWAERHYAALVIAVALAAGAAAYFLF